MAGCQLCYFQAIRLLPVGVALLIEYLGIVGVVGWMWARHGQRPRRLTLAGSAAALAGLALVLGVFGHATLNVAGVAWALGAAFGLGAFFVLAAGSTADLPPVALASAGMGVGAVALLGLGGAGVLPMHATFGVGHVRRAPGELAGPGAGPVAGGRGAGLRGRRSTGPGCSARGWPRSPG